MISFPTKNFIYANHDYIDMLENITLAAYAALGFAISYLALEGAWHFTACRIKERSLPPCIFKQVKTKFITSSRMA
jgi:hypothetical protein